MQMKKICIFMAGKFVYASNGERHLKQKIKNIRTFSNLNYFNFFTLLSEYNGNFLKKQKYANSHKMASSSGLVVKAQVVGSNHSLVHCMKKTKPLLHEL